MVPADVESVFDNSMDVADKWIPILLEVKSFAEVLLGNADPYELRVERFETPESFIGLLFSRHGKVEESRGDEDSSLPDEALV